MLSGVMENDSANRIEIFYNGEDKGQNGTICSLLAERVLAEIVKL